MKANAGKAKKKPPRGRAVAKVIQVRGSLARNGAKLSRGRKDTITWKNHDADAYRLVFARWPFEGKRRRVPLPAKKRSATLKVKSNARKGPVKYSLVTTGIRRGGPDPPGVSVGE